MNVDFCRNMKIGKVLDLCALPADSRHYVRCYELRVCGTIYTHQFGA